MSDDLSQEPRFDENQYARPNRQWTCGWAADGSECPLGPTRSGTCRSAWECAPYKKEDTWTCSRISSHGGPCEEGPLPDGTCCRPIPKCQPVRSLMARRGIVSLSVFVLAIGTALVMVSSSNRTSLISPGALTPQHSTVVHGCAECHVGGEGRMSDWIDASFDADAAAKQSSLCLTCHRDLGENALQPHGQQIDVLAKITERIHDTQHVDGESPRLMAARAIGSPHGDLACATCHREHQGADFDLTRMTNDQCQVCHAKAFHNFGSGHPEFSNFPYDRRTRIYFDHQSHYGQHFGGDTKAACSECHSLDDAGRYMRVRGFEASCARCHTQQIEDDLTPGLVFAAIPGLDTATLKEKGIEIGEWPSLYPLHVEAHGDPSLLIHWLLDSHQSNQEILERLENVDLCDLSEATPEQIADVERFAWEFKYTLHDVVQGGQAHVQQQLAGTFAPQGTEATAADLANLVPIEMVREMQRRWLPHLMEEVEAHRGGNALPDQVEPPPIDAGKKIADEKRTLGSIASGWYLRESDLSLHYRPTGHADALLKTLFDINAARSNAELSSPFAAGRCAKCHSSDATETGGVQINWFAKRPQLTRHRFTEFKHAPHVTLLDDNACLRCHEFAAAESTRQILRPEYFDGWNPSTNPRSFVSNFTSMSKANCAECHTTQAAGDSCLTCHGYHVR